MFDRIGGGRVRLVLLAMGAGAGLTAGALIVSAQIPDAAGKIHACINNSGQMRIVETSDDCRHNETSLSWVADALPIDGTAADADLLDGLDSTDFLRTTGKAADANLLDGLDSSAFVQGGGNVVRHVADVTPGESAAFSTGLSTITFNCPSTLSDPGSIEYSNDSAGLAPTWIDTAAGQSFFRVGVANVSVPTAAGGDHISIAAVHQLQPNRTVLAEVFVAQDTVFNVCTVYAHVVQN